ncbi:hypothetical protein V6N13_100191 [Hibiscus sabdariffa]|uniref:Hydroxyproline-rich glycoprotein family protein n=1 Tax=Hibiscus sabdariffa TaxID=183260 RepID=A0ABR2B7K6_9ROSI
MELNSINKFGQQQHEILFPETVRQQTKTIPSPLPMAPVSESPQDSPNPNPPPLPPAPPPPSDSPSRTDSNLPEQVTPWIDYAVEQAVLYQKIVDGNINATIDASRSRFSEIRSTSSAHFNQTIGRFSSLFFF